MIVLWFGPDGGQPSRELSVVIPLKGWDESLPRLLDVLLSDPFDAPLQILVVVDSDQPNLHLLPEDDRLIVLQSEPKPDEWLDKNWRLYQGARRAGHETILFMDSDTQPYPKLLTRRCSNHVGPFSFCIPVYTAPCSQSERFLASFTSYNNFFVYCVGFSFGSFGTAIGPSMMASVPRAQLLEALTQGRGQSADDHALGYWMARHGFPVHIAKVPVIVGKDGETWSGAWQQIIRWITVSRTVKHMLSLRLIISAGFAMMLNTLPSLMIYTGLIATVSGYRDGLFIAGAGLMVSALDGLWLALVERSYVARCDLTPSGWWHVLYVPILHLLQPVMVAVGYTRREIHWRGSVIKLN